jgi:hypothetical protein
VSFQCPFLDMQSTTHHSYESFKIVAMFELGMSTLGLSHSKLLLNLAKVVTRFLSAMVTQNGVNPNPMTKFILQHYLQLRQEREKERKTSVSWETDVN